LALRAGRQSANRDESALTGFAADILSVRSDSTVALEALSPRPDSMEEQVPDADNERWMDAFDPQ
jgi:hypothetical protein